MQLHIMIQFIPNHRIVEHFSLIASNIANVCRMSNVVDFTSALIIILTNRMQFDITATRMKLPKWNRNRLQISCQTGKRTYTYESLSHKYLLNVYWQLIVYGRMECQPQNAGQSSHLTVEMKCRLHRIGSFYFRPFDLILTTIDCSINK